MNVTVIFFGQLAALAGNDKLNFEQVKDTHELVEQLQKKFPSFNNTSYIIAVNKTVVNQNTILNNGATVALLPPFSGG